MDDYSSAQPGYPGEPSLDNHDHNDREVLLNNSTAPQSSDRPRKRRRGGKIYSGCGTCRMRKIKCDGGRPKCCNCERSRLYVCDGYDENANTFAVEPLDHDALDWTGLVTEAAGPPITDTIVYNGMQTEHFGAPNMATWDHLGDFLNIFDDGIPFRSPDRGLSSMPTGTVFSETPRCCSTVESIPNEEVDRIPIANVDKQPTSFSMNSIPLPLDPVSGFMSSHAVQRLVHHYRSHVCQLMMPTTAPSLNPWLQIYLPLATQEPSGVPQRILLYAILAVAAFNWAYLAPTDGDKDRDLKLASDYNDQAASLLKTALDPNALHTEVGDDKRDRLALMAAALTLTTAEVFSGARAGAGYEHLELCKRVVKVTGGLKWWSSDPTCLTLLQIFRCLQIVSSTSGRPKSIHAPDAGRRPQGMEGFETAAQASPSAPVPAHLEQGLSIPLPTGGYSLDITFGVSSKTLRCLHKIVELSEDRATLDQTEPWPRGHVDALNQLEHEIFNKLEDTEGLFNEAISIANGQQSSSNYISDLIKVNHMTAFHFSTAIFFRRALCSGSSEHESSANGGWNSTKEDHPKGQLLVSKALEHLENIDAIAHDIPIANTLWPGFIAAVEAYNTDLRHRALIWLARAKRRGIGNIVQATNLVTETWRRVDRQSIERDAQDDLANVDWRDVMREKNMYFMLT